MEEAEYIASLLQDNWLKANTDNIIPIIDIIYNRSDVDVRKSDYVLIYTSGSTITKSGGKTFDHIYGVSVDLRTAIRARYKKHIAEIKRILSGKYVISDSVSTTLCADAGDSYVSMVEPDANFNHDTEIAVDYDRFFALLTFNIPTSVTDLQSAKIKLTVSINSGDMPTITVKRIVTAWNETLVTWNNQPIVSDDHASSVILGLYDSVLEIDVTELLKDIYASLNYGFALYTSSNIMSAFSSKEHAEASRHPVLELKENVETARIIEIVRENDLSDKTRNLYRRVIDVKMNKYMQEIIAI